jgi:tetratricopeptide (TPR) repeat protein
MLQGDFQEAHRIWERGLSRTHWEPGPTLYVYRGECYRRQGELELARDELETAVRQKPQRLSARINLALLDRDPEALVRVERDCTAFAPLLMAELKGSPAERLEQVLEAMRGNRSSSEWNMSYHLWGRLWRRGVADDARGAP